MTDNESSVNSELIEENSNKNLDTLKLVLVPLKYEPMSSWVSKKVGSYPRGFTVQGTHRHKSSDEETQKMHHLSKNLINFRSFVKVTKTLHW